MKLFAFLAVATLAQDDYAYDTDVSGERGKNNKGNNNNGQYNQQLGGGDDNNGDGYVAPDIGSGMCWKCDGASSLADCYANGETQYCRRPESEELNEDFTSSVCMVTMRKYEGAVYEVHMGCKDKDACLEQKSNNFKNGKKFKMNECKPTATYDYATSTCRQCCSGDNCTGTKVSNSLVDGSSNIGDWKRDNVNY